MNLFTCEFTYKMFSFPLNDTFYARCSSRWFLLAFWVQLSFHISLIASMLLTASEEMANGMELWQADLHLIHVRKLNWISANWDPYVLFFIVGIFIFRDNISCTSVIANKCLIDTSESQWNENLAHMYPIMNWEHRTVTAVYTNLLQSGIFLPWFPNESDR